MPEPVFPPQPGQTVRRRVIGIDPGFSGAVAALDVEGGRVVALEVHDMPTLVSGKARTAKSKGRTKMDPAGTVRLFEKLAAPLLLDETPILVVLEDVASRPGEAPSGAFSFGHGKGVLEGVIAALRLPLTLVTPTEWKRVMRVPVAPDGIVARADQLFPAHAAVWRGPRGGLMDGRAEAAILALWGCQN